MSGSRRSVRLRTGERLTDWKTDFERITADSKLHLQPTVTLARIQRMLASKSSDIVADAQKVSLVCPLSKRRTEVPARGAACGHLRCFDLETFLRDTNREGEIKWKCPVCNNILRLEEVRVDKYFAEVCAAVEADAKEVQIDADGAYRGISPSRQDVVVLDDNESEASVGDDSVKANSQEPDANVAEAQSPPSEDEVTDRLDALVLTADTDSSASEATEVEQPQRRRSSRIRIPRLNHAVGEHIVYRKDAQGNSGIVGITKPSKASTRCFCRCAGCAALIRQ